MYQLKTQMYDLTALKVRSLKQISLCWNQVVSRAAFLLEAPGETISLPCPACRGCPNSVAHVSLPSSKSKWPVEPFSLWISLTVSHVPLSPLYKGPFDYSGPTTKSRIFSCFKVSWWAALIPSTTLVSLAI